MTNLIKSKRKQDLKLLKLFRDKCCLVCGKQGCDPAHIKTKGSGGDDNENNLMPLCRLHHVEQHKIGIITFIKKYPDVYSYIKNLGFYISEYNKLIRN